MTSVYSSFSDIFRIGIGPSSSHTVGPMRAARLFVHRLEEDGILKNVKRIQCELWGSLGATGSGHHTPNAIIAGLQGFSPSTYSKKETEITWDLFEDGIESRKTKQVFLPLLQKRRIKFFISDIIFLPEKQNKLHPNCLVLKAYSDEFAEKIIREEMFLSPGGGTVQIVKNSKVREVAVKTETNSKKLVQTMTDDVSDFKNANDLLSVCAEFQTNIAQIARRQEFAHSEFEFSDEELDGKLDHVWDVMNSCIESGLSSELQTKEPMVSKRLNLPRRAPTMFAHLKDLKKSGVAPRSETLSCYAIAVNEQNASGERIVTAPTAGSAGVIPAVLRFWIEQKSPNLRFLAKLNHSRNLKPLIREFLLTAAVFGSIIKANGSISGAECGCQAEVGSACAMAAAGLTHVRGGTPKQVENAAEIALEYHLGLTCDPVGGLVFIPCIERNAMAANTAVTACELALAGNGDHRVSLDTAIETMRQTGIDMNSAYKETSRAGLATTVHC